MKKGSVVGKAGKEKKVKCPNGCAPEEMKFTGHSIGAALEYTCNCCGWRAEGNTTKSLRVIFEGIGREPSTEEGLPSENESPTDPADLTDLRDHEPKSGPINVIFKW